MRIEEGIYQECGECQWLGDNDEVCENCGMDTLREVEVSACPLDETGDCQDEFHHYGLQVHIKYVDV